MFLSSHGTLWCDAWPKLGDDGRRASVSHHDLVGIEFAKVAESLGLMRPGVSFAARRHTFRSIADEHPNAEAVKWIMGHTQEGMSRWYVHKHERMFERLRSVTELAHSYLVADRARANIINRLP